MAKFTGSEVDDLGYDFTKVLPDPIEEADYTPGPTAIPEPTTLQITSYLGAYSSLMRANGNAVQNWIKKITSVGDDGGNDDIEAERAQLDKEYEAWSVDNAAATIARRKDLLARVCTGSPDADDYPDRCQKFRILLDRLPGRWLDAFEGYIQDELTGKASSGTSS
jgi:hypothetical protein